MRNVDRIRLLTVFLIVGFVLTTLFLPVWLGPLESGAFYQDEQKVVEAIWRGDSRMNINDPAVFYVYEFFLGAEKLSLFLPFFINLVFIFIQVLLLIKVSGVPRVTLVVILAAMPIQELAYVYGPSKDILPITALLVFLYGVVKNRGGLALGFMCCVVVAIMKPLFLLYFPLILVALSGGSFTRKLSILLLIVAGGTGFLFYDLRSILGGYSFNLEMLLLYLSLDYEAIYGPAYADLGHVSLPTKLAAYIVGPLHSLQASGDPYSLYQSTMSVLAGAKITVLVGLSVVTALFAKVNYRYAFLAISVLLITSLFYFGVNYRYRIIFELFVGLVYLSSYRNAMSKRVFQNAR